MRRWGLIGLAVLVGVTGCGTIAVLSGPRVLKAGDTATYVLGLGGVDIPGNSTLYLGCDVPSSWALLNNSYLGTAGGNPVSGSALVTTTYDTDDIPPPGDGNQRIWLTDGPFRLDPGDAAEVNLVFDVADVPAGEFVIRFWLVSTGNPYWETRPFAAVIVNREPRWFDFLGSFFVPDGALVEGRTAAASSDGRTVVLGGAGDPDPVISVFDRDPLTGALSHNHTLDLASVVLWFDHLVFAPDSDHLYGCGRGFLAFLHRDSTTGRVTLEQLVDDGLGGSGTWDDARKIAISPDGRHLYLATGDALVVFERDGATGLVTLLSYFWDQYLEGPCAVAVSPDGVFVYALGNDNDSLVVLDRNQQTGALTFRQFFLDFVGGVEGLDVPRDVVVSSDGRHVYVAGHYADAVTIFKRDLLSGGLTYLGAIREGVGDVLGIRAPLGLVLSPDDRTLFVSSSKSLAIYQRNPISGELSLLQVDYDGEGGVTGIFSPSRPAVSPDGVQLFHPDPDAMAVFFAGSRVFGDGFESGDTGSWDVTSP